MGHFYRHACRPLIFALKPETAHKAAKAAGRWASGNEFVLDRISRHYQLDDERLHAVVYGIELRNPVGLAAGYDKNGEMAELFSALGCGYSVIGSVTAERNTGNVGERLFRLPEDESALNRMGLDSDGCVAVRKNLEKAFGIPVFVNIAKTNDKSITGQAAMEDYGKSFRALYGSGRAIELNISCPNTGDGRSFEDPESLDRLLGYLRLVEKEIAPDEKQPLIIKISPDNDYGRLGEIVDVCERRGADGYTLTNASLDWDGLTTDGMLLDGISKRYGKAGLSGRAISRKSKACVERVYKLTGGKKPINGCGGIFDAQDAISMMMHGASTIQVHTGLPYEGPSMIRGIKAGMLDYMDAAGYEKVGEMTGRLVDF